MNIFMKYRFAAFAVVIFLITPGCKKEKKTTTIINNDGSCVRTIVVNPASDTISTFPVPDDKSWDIHLEGDTDKSFIAVKKFDNVNRMNDEYRMAKKVGVDITFEKKFRWFFTYYSYREAYKSSLRIQRIPIQTFLTEKEYAQYERGDTGSALKKRIDDFLTANVNEEFYNQLVDSVERMHDPSIPVSVFIAKKQDIELHEFDKGETKDIVKYLERILGLVLQGKIERPIENITKSIEDDIRFMLDAGGDYVNEVQMPGIILNTNANTVEGNTVVWRFNEDRFAYTGYTMAVESRIANPWAAYATGGVLIVIIALLLLPRWKRK
jgi:TolB-like protein